MVVEKIFDNQQDVSYKLTGVLSKVSAWFNNIGVWIHQNILNMCLMSVLIQNFNVLFRSKMHRYRDNLLLPVFATRRPLVLVASKSCQISDKTVQKQACDRSFKFGAKTCSSQFGHQVATNVYRGPRHFSAKMSYDYFGSGRSEIELLFVLRRTVTEIEFYFRFSPPGGHCHL